MERVTDSDVAAIRETLTALVPVTDAWRLETDAKGVAIWVSEEKLIDSAFIAARAGPYDGSPERVGEAGMDGVPAVVV